MRRTGVLAALLVGSTALAGCASTGSGSDGGWSASPPSSSSSAPTPAGAPADDARREAATPAPSGGPRGVAVAPARLRHGADPRLPWWDATTSRLHDGRFSVRVTLTGSRPGDVVSLDRAGPAYVLVAAGRSGPTAFRVGRDGSTRVLARTRSAPLVLAVATDGRTFAWIARQGGAQATVAVSRTSDGTEVARRRFRDEQLRVLTLSSGRALVGTHRATLAWDLRTGGVSRVLTDTGLLASRDGARVVAGRAPDDTPAYVTGRATPGPWSLPRAEDPQQLSPDGRLLVTGTPHDADLRGYDVFLRPLVVRDASSGRVRARFDGRFGWYDAGGPRWEDDDHVLAVAREPAYDSGQPTIRLTWVRCEISTRSCETAGPPATLRLDVPPYGVLPRLVAAAPPT